MKKFLFLLLLALATASTKADTIRLTINSAPYNDGHFGVGFYNSTLTYGNPDPYLSIPLLTVCIDFTHHVSFNQSFDITLVNLANYAGPLHDNYWQAGWLALQLQTTTDLATISDIQRAIWLITTPGTDNPYLTTLAAFGWANQAAQNYQSVAESNFVLYLRSGEAGQAQLSVVPEPTVFALAGVGVIALVGFRRLLFPNAAPR